MTITIKFFASLREQVGRAEDHLQADGPLSVAEAWSRACPGMALPEHVLAAVNMEYAPRDHPVRDGDEVAFFPPVTGGCGR